MKCERYGTCPIPDLIARRARFERVLEKVNQNAALGPDDLAFIEDRQHDAEFLRGKISKITMDLGSVIACSKCENADLI